MKAGPKSQQGVANDESSPGFAAFVSRRVHSAAWWIAGAYALFATLWIYFSDRALSALVPDPDLLIQMSVYKGIAFVLVTAVLLFLMIRLAYGRIEDGYVALRHQELEIKRLQRLYAALNQINQAIVRASSSEELFHRACGALVKHGGFRHASLVWRDWPTGNWIPVADAGSEETAPDETLGRELFETHGKGLETGVNNDLRDAGLSPECRSTAARQGLLAWAGIPIRQHGNTLGILNVYAASAGFFQAQEIALLEEAAVDISFALDNFAREADRQRALAAVERERSFSEMMLESMPGILYLFDYTGRYLRWNRRFAEVSEYSEEEIGKVHPLELVEEKDRETVQTRIEEVFAKGESTVEASFVSKSGRSTPHFFTGRQVEFDGVPCVVGMGIDITERIDAENALKKSEERHRTTLDNILEACQLIDFNWNYLYLNQAASIQNRRPNEELLGRKMQDAWPGIEEIGYFAQIRRCMEERVPVHEEMRFLFRDGSEGWFDVRAQPVPEGIYLLSIDITERYYAERALHELNESLETKVGERTAELNEALVRAESADRLKSAFLATMSHELRTPLNSIIGFTGIVLQGLAGPLNEEQSKQLGMVRGSARHLLDLINDVLDLSKIEAGQFEIRAERFDLRESVEKVVNSIRPLAEKKDLTLDLSLADEVGSFVSDRRRIEQILLNLLNNAIKFTESGKVSITVVPHPVSKSESGGVPDRTGAISFRIADTGIGIRQSDLDQLFLPFRQIDSGMTRLHEGTGLGLAICRRLAGLLDGEIRVESEWEKGSVFTVLIPNQTTNAP